MSDDLRAVRLPGESPCRFIAGADGWMVCDVHGWTGPASQRSRVLVCPEAVVSRAVAPGSCAAEERHRLRAALLDEAMDDYFQSCGGWGCDDERRADFQAVMALLTDTRSEP